MCCVSSENIGKHLFEDGRKKEMNKQRRDDEEEEEDDEKTQRNECFNRKS